MSIEGWYYLHTNGDLIYKRELGDTVADLRESDFVRAIWPFDPENRESLWNLLVESFALGVAPQRVHDLAAKWGCDNDDAVIYADRINCTLEMDGASWCATRLDFINLQESVAAFGDSALIAMGELCKALGFRPSKLWGAHFKDLLTSTEVKQSNGHH